MSARWWMLVLGAALSASCHWGKVDKPAPPDTRALREEFDAPTADLGALSLAQVTPILLAAIDQAEDYCGLSPFDPNACPPGEDCARCPFEDHVGEMLAKIAQALHGDGGDVVSLPGVDGTLEIESICRGWDKPTPDPAHGHVKAFLSFSGDGLDPVVWGHAYACEERSGRRDRPQRYDGDFILTYEPALLAPFDELHTLPFVLSYEGTIYDRTLDLTFPLRAATRQRLDGVGQREFLLRTPLGSLVAQLGMGAVTIRARSRSFDCNVQAMTCAER